MPTTYDAVLLVSFGGPEGPDDVLPFLENVLRGKNVPRERMLEVVEHYQQSLDGSEWLTYPYSPRTGHVGPQGVGLRAVQGHKGPLV